VAAGRYFRDAVVFGVDGMSLVPERRPVLRDHGRSGILGCAAGRSKAGRLEIRGTFLDGSGEAGEACAMADEGRPWRLPVRIMPDRIEEVGLGGRAVVNGRGVAGPVKIFREPAVREAGFRSVVADRGTGAAVFAVGKPGQQEVAVSGNSGRTRAEAAKAAEPPAASGGAIAGRTSRGRRPAASIWPGRGSWPASGGAPSTQPPRGWSCRWGGHRRGRGQNA
jgi:hypothetical protein